MTPRRFTTSTASPTTPALICALVVACSPRVKVPATETADEATDSGTPESGASESGAQDLSDSADTGIQDDTAALDSPTARPCDAYADPVQTGTIVDEALDELSGLAVSRLDPDLLWAHEDRGGEVEIYAIDPLGNTLATVTLEDASNIDWEDLAIGPCDGGSCIFVGDIGNNAHDRDDLGIYVFEEPSLSALIFGEATLSDWEWYAFEYPDEIENAEALAVTSGGLPLLLSKRTDDESSNVYLIPELDSDEEVTAEPLGTISTGVDGGEAAAALTAADLWWDDSSLLFRTYSSVYEIDLNSGLSAISSAPSRGLGGAAEPHGEAIAYDPWRGGFWQVSEGVNPAIWFIGCAG